MSNKNTVAQQKASGEKGRFGHLAHRESTDTSLSAANEPEQGTIAWLNDLPGSEWDIRYVPESPLRAGVEARIRVSENTASLYAYQLESAEEHAEDDLFFGGVQEGSTFELVETVRSDKMSAPDLVAIAPDGSRNVVGSQENLPLEHEFEPVLIDGDGNFWDPSTMRHATSNWMDAIEADKELDEERTSRCHELIDAMGWKITPYNAPRNEWMIDMSASGGTRLKIDRYGELTETSNYRPATTDHLIEAISKDALASEDTAHMVRETLKLLASRPTPGMQHWASKADLIKERESLHGRPYADLAKAQKIVDILAGKAEAPPRGDIAKIMKQIQDDRAALDAAKARHEKAKANVEQYESQLKTLPKLPPLISQTVHERLETLKTSASAYGGEVFKANTAYERSSGMWQRQLDEQQKVEQRRNEIDEQLDAMDEAFAAQ